MLVTRGACDGLGAMVPPACGRPQCEGVFSVHDLSVTLTLNLDFTFFRIRKIVIQSVLFFFEFVYRIAALQANRVQYMVGTDFDGLQLFCPAFSFYYEKNQVKATGSGCWGKFAKYHVSGM